MAVAEEAEEAAALSACGESCAETARTRVGAAVRTEVERLVNEHAFAPMWGLAGGDKLVNVLELNLALDALK